MIDPTFISSFMSNHSHALREVLIISAVAAGVVAYEVKKCFPDEPANETRTEIHAVIAIDSTAPDGNIAKSDEFSIPEINKKIISVIDAGQTTSDLELHFNQEPAADASDQDL